MKKIEIQKPFFEMIENTTCSLGFKKQKNKAGYKYARPILNGYNGIIPLITQYDTLFFISVAFQLRIDDISKILIYIENVGEEFQEEYSTFSFGIIYFDKYTDDRFRIETFEELDNALKTLKNIIEESALVFFENFKTIADIDKEMNKNNRPKDLYCNEISSRPFVGLIAAVLNKNPQAKYWESYYRENLQNKNQHLKNQYEKLVSYLKENYAGVL